jgi:hypothetical protein
VSSRLTRNRKPFQLGTGVPELASLDVVFHPQGRISLDCAGAVRQVTYIADVTTGVTRQQVSHLRFLKSLLFVSRIFSLEISFGRMDFNRQQL